MFVDTHCHLSKNDYDSISSIIVENEKALVDKMIVSCCSRDSIDEGLNFKDEYDLVYLTIGYHPEYADEINEIDLSYLKDNLSKKKIVGIGEIGLDYHYGKNNRMKQISLFEEQLKIAEELDLPVVIHSRDATLDTINILKKYNVRGVIHCFSGSLETANIYINMGFLLGIGGVITFKNSTLKEVVKNIPLENIVLETDSPYLTPAPYRGKINSSKYIKYIAEFIALIKNTNLDDVAKISKENAYRIFDFTK